MHFFCPGQVWEVQSECCKSRPVVPVLFLFYGPAVLFGMSRIAEAGDWEDSSMWKTRRECGFPLE